MVQPDVRLKIKMRIKKNKFLVAFLSLALAPVLPLSGFAQGAKPTVVAIPQATGAFIPDKDQKLDSKLMGREMPYRILLPKNYASDAQARFPVIYLLHGLTGHYNNWSEKTKLAEYLAAYNFIIVTPEGNDGWYTDSATVPNDKYESYIVQELIPEIDKNFRTIADREHRMMAGLSMGGYGSLKFGLKYPEKFIIVGSFSGALGAAGWTKTAFEKMGIKGAIPASLVSVYGADDSQTRKDNDVYEIVKNLTPEKIKALPFIYQSCGTEDFLIQDNRNFLALLNEKKIAHEYRESPGIHNWVFWDTEVEAFLKLANKINRPPAK